MSTVAEAADAEIDRLYGLPLARFIEARDGLAKRLRGDGRRAQADEVKKLGRPTAAAWTVNQVIRNEPEKRQALLEAADALRTAQETLAGGKADVDELRSAAEAEREAVDALLATAGAHQAGRKVPSQTTLERVRETLHAAALDPEARQQVEAARLTHELPAVGFGLIAAGASAKSKAKSRRTQAHDSRVDDKERKLAAAERRRQIQQDLGTAAEKAKDERSALARKRRELEKAKSARDKAQRRLDRLEDECRETEERLGAAKKRVAREERRLRGA